MSFVLRLVLSQFTKNNNNIYKNIKYTMDTIIQDKVAGMQRIRENACEESDQLEPKAKKMKESDKQELTEHDNKLEQPSMVNKSLQDSLVQSNSPTSKFVDVAHSEITKQTSSTTESKVKEAGNEELLTSSTRKWIRKKVILFLSYSGKGYFGMQKQKNDGVKTIEGDLINVLLKLGVVDHEANTKLGQIE